MIIDLENDLLGCGKWPNSQRPKNAIKVTRLNHRRSSKQTYTVAVLRPCVHTYVRMYVCTKIDQFTKQVSSRPAAK